MPRVHTVTNNRKEQKCGKCGATVTVGAGYRHWSFRYGGKVKRCLVCPAPRPSELTQSGYLQQLYGAQENFDDTVSGLDRSDWEGFRDAIVSSLEDAEQTARDCVDEYEDALSEWEHGNSMIEEKKDACEEWADALESAKSDIEGEEPDLPDEIDEDDEEITDEEKQEYKDERELAIDNFLSEIEGKANDAIYELSM